MVHFLVESVIWIRIRMESDPIHVLTNADPFPALPLMLIRFFVAENTVLHRADPDRNIACKHKNGGD